MGTKVVGSPVSNFDAYAYAYASQFDTESGTLTPRGGGLKSPPGQWNSKVDHFARKAGGAGANILKVRPSTVEPPE
jgi:hypothetical protein